MLLNHGKHNLASACFSNANLSSIVEIWARPRLFIETMITTNKRQIEKGGFFNSLERENDLGLRFLA